MKEKLHWPETLRVAMKAAEINNVALGREIGVSHVAIGNYLKGDKPKSEHLLALANFFKVPMDWFFGRSFFLDALEKSGIHFEHHGRHLDISIKEHAEVSSGRLLIEVGRLIESGLSPAEILRRLHFQPEINYKKKPSSKTVADTETVVDVFYATAQKKNPEHSS